MASVIGNSTAAVAVGLEVFNSYLQQMHGIGAFAAAGTLPQDSPLGGIGVRVEVDPAPQFELGADSQGAPYPRLLLQGTATSVANPTLTLPFSLALRVALELNAPQDADPLAWPDAPALTVHYVGPDGAPPSPLTQEQLDALLRSTGLPDKLSFRFDTLLPKVVEELEGELFDVGSKPSRSSWGYRVELRTARAGYGAAVVVFLAAPLGLHNPPLPMETLPPSHSLGSFLPADLGFGVAIGNTGIGRIFRRQADARVGTETNGATIRSLEMTLIDNSLIYVKGRATRTGVEVRWEGPIRAELRRGERDWRIDASGVGVDVDRDWWVTLFEFGGLGILSLPFALYFESKVAGAPGEVRSAFSDIMQHSLAELANGLSATQANPRVAVTTTVSEGRLINNAINVFADVVIRAVIPDVRGTWNSNVGLTFDITQPSLAESAFSWTVRERPMGGAGHAAGGWISAEWMDFGRPVDATGAVQANEEGQATEIRFGNGLVLSKGPVAYDPSVVVLVPDVRGIWDSNLGLTFDLTQPADQGGRFTWTVRQRPMPGAGQIEGLDIPRVQWTDFGQQFDATGRIDVLQRGFAQQITLSNGAVLVRAVVPNLRGAWRSNIGLTFDIGQIDVGMTFDWTVRERPMPGHGETIGSWLRVAWTDSGQSFEATGIVERNANNYATRIQLSNGVIFTR